MGKLLRDCHQAAKDLLHAIDRGYVDSSGLMVGTQESAFVRSLRQSVKAVDDEQSRIAEWRQRADAGELDEGV